MLGEVNGAGAAGPEAFEDAIAAQAEAPPFALQQLFGLEVGQQPFAHHQGRQLPWVVGQAGATPAVRQEGLQTGALDLIAPLNQAQKVLDRCWRRHLFPLDHANRTAPVPEVGKNQRRRTQGRFSERGRDNARKRGGARESPCQAKRN